MISTQINYELFIDHKYFIIFQSQEYYVLFNVSKIRASCSTENFHM